MFKKKRKPLSLNRYTAEALNILQAVLDLKGYGYIAEVDIYPPEKHSTEVWFYFFTRQDFEKAEEAGNSRPPIEERRRALVEFGQSVHLYKGNSMACDRVYVFQDGSGKYRF